MNAQSYTTLADPDHAELRARLFRDFADDERFPLVVVMRAVTEGV